MRTPDYIIKSRRGPWNECECDTFAQMLEAVEALATAGAIESPWGCFGPNYDGPEDKRGGFDEAEYEQLEDAIERGLAARRDAGDRGARDVDGDVIGAAVARGLDGMRKAVG
jgi:hypothetical protein